MGLFDTLGGIISGGAEILGKEMERHKAHTELILNNCCFNSPFFPYGAVAAFPNKAIK